MRLFLATGDALLVLTKGCGGWTAEARLEGMPTRCLAVDPVRPEVVYCGTFGRGLYRSEDGGDSWRRAGDGIAHGEVTAVAVSPTEPGCVWAGTEPSALFCSDDGGGTWRVRPGLQDIPSRPTWSFPPRPWTHHVRWIEPDPVVAGRLFVGIELGGVMRSDDDGRTWQDRKPGAKLDAHTLRTHRLAPGRVYEAAGDGYAETADGGATWSAADQGLPWRYLWGLAVDPADPATAVVSASPGPRHAHDAVWDGNSADGWRRAAPGSERGARTPRAALGMQGPPPWAGHEWRGPEAWLYRRSGTGAWEAVTQGLPPARGTLAYVLAQSDAEPHVFYASPRSDAVLRSADAGRSWEALPVAGPAGPAPRRIHALAVAPL